MSHVKQISHKDFLPNAMLSKKYHSGYTIIMLYKNQCTYCQKLKPDYITSARLVCCTTTICALDCSQNSDIIKKHINDSLQQIVVSTFPQILRYRDGKFLDVFTKPRTQDNLKSFMLGTDNDVVQQIKSSKFTTIMFMAEWCGHCQRTLPEFKKAKLNLSQENQAFELEADKDKQIITTITSQYPIVIQGYPTIIRFKNGAIHATYNGTRTQESLHQFMQGN